MTTTLGSLKTAIAFAHSLDQLSEDAPVTINGQPVARMQSRELPDGSWSFDLVLEQRPDQWTAVDIENGQSFGPFASRLEAIAAATRFMIHNGEWSTDDDIVLEAIKDFSAQALEEDSARWEQLAQELSETQWMLVPMQPLDIEPTDAALQAAVDAGYEQHIEERRAEQGEHAYECWIPRGGECRAGCSCACHKLSPDEERFADEMIGQLRDAAIRHDSHSHDAADGADGRDAHAS